jgi:MIP family channel proteins
MYNLSQKLTAEFLGTFALVFFGAGAVCVDFQLRGNSTAGIGLLAMALAPGLAVAILSTALAHISGAHFNPAVTIGFWVTKRLNTLDALSYWGAQLLGATAAAFLLKVVIPVETWRGAIIGAPTLMLDFPRWGGLALEATATFFLVLVFFATMVEEHGTFRVVGGFGIGFTYTVGILIAGPFTGGALNPARAFGPAFASGHWLNQGIYWIGPLIGGFLGGLLYDSVFLRKSEI